MQYFSEIDGMRDVFKELESTPALLLDTNTSYPLLLQNTTLLPLSIKQKWLQLMLADVVEQKNPSSNIIRLYNVDRQVRN